MPSSYCFQLGWFRQGVLETGMNCKTLIWAVTRDFQQWGILTNVDSDEPVQPPYQLRNSKWCSVCSITLVEYSSGKQRLWSDWAYAQGDLRLCSSHILHCWKTHVTAHLVCIFIWPYRRYKQKSPKYETAKYSFKFSYTISNKWIHILRSVS